MLPRFAQKRPSFASVTLVLAVVLTSTAAIREGNDQRKQEDMYAQLSAQVLCGNGICEEGEDELLCPPCLDGFPPEFCECVITCELDCDSGASTTPPPTDPCALMDCQFGCSEGTCHEYGCNAAGLCVDPPFDPPVQGIDICSTLFCEFGCREGQCLPDPEPPEDLCKGKFCTYGCLNGDCLPPPATSCDPHVCSNGTMYPRCSDDGAPINYLVAPCTQPNIFCHSSQECTDGKTCTVEMGDCLSDPSCPECDVCVGTCILTDQTQAGNRSHPSEQNKAIPLDQIFTETRSQETLPMPTKNWFPDTELTSEVGKAANLLRDAKIISGYPDGTFREDNAVIRAEAAKLLLTARFGEFPKTGNDDSFWDVENGAWYVKYVIGASNLGIINGYPDGSFRPGANVNTAEFLKMLAKTFNLETGLPYYFTDVPPDAWYAQYVGVAEKMNLFPSRLLKFGPEVLLTRGEVAEAIARVLYLAQ